MIMSETTLQHTGPELPRLNPELGIMEGNAWFVDEQGRLGWTVPVVPHVFNARLAFVTPTQQPGHSTKFEVPGRPKILLGHAKVIDDAWVFYASPDSRPGEPVSDVVNRYNTARPDEPIRFVVACNKDGDGLEASLDKVWNVGHGKLRVGSYREDGEEYVEVGPIGDDTKYRPPAGILETLLADL
jgi:hypothetical protein